MVTIELKVTKELLEELNNYRAESPVIKDIFEKIKNQIQDDETEIYELQEFIYDLENIDYEQDDEKELILEEKEDPEN